MKTLLVCLILACASVAEAQCTLMPPSTGIEKAKALMDNMGGPPSTCSMVVSPYTHDSFIGCEVAPGDCDKKMASEMEHAQGPWCFFRQAAKVKSEDEVRAEIERKAAHEHRRLGPYSCTVAPFSETNKTRHYFCESEPGVCKRSVASIEASPALTKGFEQLRDAAHAAGEGYYRDMTTGRSYWCDSNGCNPR